MRKSKQKAKQAITHVISRHFLLYIIGLGMFLIFSSVALYAFSSIYLKPPTESPHNDMKKIPSDVQKNLQKEQAKTNLLATIHVPILMYHYVEYVQDKKDTIRQSLNVNPDVFDSQIKTLREAGYTFMTAKELGDVLDGKTPLPSKPILITFDDGHWDLDTAVLPILKKYNVKATAYVIAGFVGTNTDSLTPAELQDVIASGLVEVGAHTVHHLSLKGQPSVLVQYEVDESKKMLEDTYHIHVYSFAYPYGSFDQQAIDIVQKAGFTTAVSTIPGIEQNQLNRYFLYRLRPGYRTGNDLLNFLAQNEFRAY